MMTRKLIILVLLLVVGMKAQTDNQVYTFTANPPRAVASVSVGVIGQQGPANLCYWVSTIYPIGSTQPSGPFCTTTAPNTLSGSNYVQLNWTGIAGALGYTVLKTTTQQLPNGSCTCALATNTTATSLNDQGGSLTSYTYSQTPGATTNEILDNTNLTGKRLIIDTEVNVPSVTLGSYSFGGFPGSGTLNSIGGTVVYDGKQIYCTNCLHTDPCTAGGTGATARREAGAWNCADGGTGGGGTPAPPLFAVQFNQPLGSFQGSSELTFNNTLLNIPAQIGDLLTNTQANSFGPGDAALDPYIQGWVDLPVNAIPAGGTLITSRYGQGIAVEVSPSAGVTTAISALAGEFVGMSRPSSGGLAIGSLSTAIAAGTGGGSAGKFSTYVYPNIHVTGDLNAVEILHNTLDTGSVLDVWNAIKIGSINTLAGTANGLNVGAITSTGTLNQGIVINNVSGAATNISLKTNAGQVIHTSIAAAAGQTYNVQINDQGILSSAVVGPGVGAVLLAPTTDQSILGTHQLNVGVPFASLSAYAQSGVGAYNLFTVAGNTAGSGIGPTQFITDRDGSDSVTSAIQGGCYVTNSASHSGQFQCSGAALFAAGTGTNTYGIISPLTVNSFWNGSGTLEHIYDIFIGAPLVTGVGHVTNRVGLWVAGFSGSLIDASEAIHIAGQPLTAGHYALFVDSGNSDLGGNQTRAGEVDAYNAGFKYHGAAASGSVLRGNGTNFVQATLGYSDLSGTPSLNFVSLGPSADQTITGGFKLINTGGFQGILLAPDGTTAAPGITFSGSTSVGLHRSSNNLIYSALSTDIVQLDANNGIIILNTNQLTFSGSNAAGVDSYFYRSAAGTLNVGTAFNNTSGRLQAAGVRTPPILTSALPACAAGTAALRASVSDATAPALGVGLTGGGAIFAMVHCSSTTNTYIVDGL